MHSAAYKLNNRATLNGKRYIRWHDDGSIHYMNFPYFPYLITS